ncbi:hypothetical protein J437_LFUL016898, partial [Ladona fulva]
MYAAMRGILNKLTPQNFEKLVKQVLKLPIDTMEKLVGVINLIFDKAVDELNFVAAYAKLCYYLNIANIARQFKKGDDSNNENFRKILLNRCQREFEKDKATEYGLHKREEIVKEPNEEKRKEMRLQIEDDERRIRRHSVGVTRFIGELYKIGMINQSIMVTCIKELLKSGDEESLECLCELLTIIGKFLEESLEKKTAPGMGNTPNINVYFNKMENIVSERKTSSRVRFMLQDVIDLRNRKWVPRRNEANQKKIDEMNWATERESIEQSELTASYPQMSRGSGSGMSRRDEKSKGDTWSTLRSKCSCFDVDPHKLREKSSNEETEKNCVEVECDSESEGEHDKTKEERVKKVNSKKRCAEDIAVKAALEVLAKGAPDEHDRFGEYVALELRTLTSDCVRRKLKNDIRRAIINAAE